MYVPGVKHLTADATSRYPSGPSDTTTLALPDDACEAERQPRLREMLAGLRCTDQYHEDNEIDSSIRSCAIGALTQTAVTWQRVKQETASDSDMQQLLDMIEQDCMPNSRHELPVNPNSERT